MFKSVSGVIWGVDINAFYFTGKFLLKCLEGKEVVTEDKTIVEQIVVRNAVFNPILRRK